MGQMIEISPDARIRVLEMKLAQSEATLESRLVQMVELIEDRNRLVADLTRSRQANAELLRQMDAHAGYPERMALDWVQ